ncbi:MAG: sigma-54 dependent transcriptional regulator, partial [Longimicrobiales bacterium]
RPAGPDELPDAVGRLLVGRDPAMLDVYKMIGRVASGRINALIRGETGTGKERVARAIHESSPWADHPFVAVNCAALPEPLLESELFGHVKGAFTGATADRRGRFASAGSGTVLLDEIGDTTPAFQAKLLRVLEGGEFTPVGGDVPRHTGARVLAATHRDLEAAVRAGSFRTDLYYRLRVVELRLPPLRDRLGDLPALARHLLDRAVRTTDQTPAILTDEALQRLLAHSWPGNVRELDHCLTRALVLATGGVIRPEHLALDRPKLDETAAADSSNSPEQRSLGTFPTLEELEGRHLQRALALTRGNKTRAAELLGISKPRLYRMLERHGHR